MPQSRYLPTATARPAVRPPGHSWGRHGLRGPLQHGDPASGSIVSELKEVDPWTTSLRPQRWDWCARCTRSCRADPDPCLPGSASCPQRVASRGRPHLGGPRRDQGSREARRALEKASTPDLGGPRSAGRNHRDGDRRVARGERCRVSGLEPVIVLVARAAEVVQEPPSQ